MAQNTTRVHPVSEEHTILVVDDQMINIRLLERKLQMAGMRVLTATNGIDALNIAHQHLPMVILLDIMMPEMDGLEVCRRLKADKRTSDIPIIFITARDSREGKIEGLTSGAADYLTKPIDLEETLARVRTQIRIQESYQENLELNRRLEEARRRSSMIHLTEGIAHNLNNLLGIAIGYLDLIRLSLTKPERMQRSCEQLGEALKRMGRMVHELTTIGQFDAAQISEFKISDIIAEVRRRIEINIGQPVDLKLQLDLPDNFTLQTNPDLFASAMERLIVNSWESYGRLSPVPAKKPIQVQISRTVHEDMPYLKIVISDQGCGIPAEIIDTVFEPFVTTEAAIGRGMGLTIARHSAQNLGGKILLQSKPPSGTQATILHPLVD